MLSVDIFSLDFEGLFYTEDDLLQAGEHRLEIDDTDLAPMKKLVGASQASSNKKIVMNGSLHQSLFMDTCLMVERNICSSFPVYKRLADEVGIELDPLLLEDVSKGQESGYHFNLGLQNCELYKRFNTESPLVNLKNDDIDKHLSDTSQRLLVYVQMHYIAEKYPAHNIKFNYYHRDNSVIDVLKAFYLKHNNLIPSNIQLILGVYSEKSLHAARYIQGKGVINLDYKELASALIEKAKISYECSFFDDDSSVSEAPFSSIVKDLVAMHGDKVKSQHASSAVQSGVFSRSSQQQKRVVSVQPEAVSVNTAGTNEKTALLDKSESRSCWRRCLPSWRS